MNWKTCFGLRKTCVKILIFKKRCPLIDAINNETINTDRRAHMLWETPKQIKSNINLPGNNKKQKGGKITMLELSFVDSLFWMLKIKHRMDKLKNDIQLIEKIMFVL